MSSSICKILAKDKKKRIREMFSTEYILSCFSGDNLKNYRELLEDVNIKILLCDKEIVQTAEMFMKSNLNLAKASKNLYMHRNTIIYRIENLEKVTGLNIKNFDDAVIFDNMLKIYKNLM